jgi:hypothetical protein
VRVDAFGSELQAERRLRRLHGRSTVRGEAVKRGKAKFFKARKDLDGQFHRGKKGRRARKARAHKRAVERQLRQQTKKLLRRIIA